MTTADRPQLVKQLSDLPPPETHVFALQVRNLLKSEPSDGMLEGIASDVGQAKQVRFAAVYAMQVRNWRRSDFSKHRAITEKYSAELGEEPMYQFLWSQYYMTKQRDTSNLLAALSRARDAMVAAPSVPGVKHQYALAVATAAEEFPELISTEELIGAEREIQEAKALADQPYGRYEATLARLQLLRGSWSEARDSISRAIEIEDSGAPDYTLRLAEYHLIRARIPLARQAEELQREQAVALAELGDARRDSLQMLGLLAAVIAFLVITVNIATRFPIREASGLILVASGALLLVFVGLSVLFGRARAITVGVVLGLSGLLLVIGLVAGAFSETYPTDTGPTDPAPATPQPGTTSGGTSG